MAEEEEMSAEEYVERLRKLTEKYHKLRDYLAKDSYFSKIAYDIDKTVLGPCYFLAIYQLTCEYFGIQPGNYTLGTNFEEEDETEDTDEKW